MEICRIVLMNCLFQPEIVHTCLSLNPGAYQVVEGGVLINKNSAQLLNKVQEVWYHLFIFYTISDNIRHLTMQC